MKMHPNEVLLYYDPKMSTARKALAYINSTGRKIRAVEYHKERFTPTIWRDILAKLNLTPKQLVNKADPYYQEFLKGREFEDDDWIRILVNRPDLIRAPIAVRGAKAVLLDNPTDAYRLE